ncbi:MAG: hypothetical protein QM396_07175 [Euryarchaeota archaeon]|jgi:hypothetical protein|uniref:Uncharacterized protein n=1 Tax=uncultured archaeal virus TaxID=1960247 RepID=A0ABM9HVH3_9VIRU|nr:hypothetical protein [Euryarchaeota archaeon]CAH2570258.1 unnamed protein product [uncultured archaeal virus]CAI3524000.1 unnamed protein product [uncultured archaeal virus]CAI4043381.1 unnamed protein product [uncultured archaeal virus]
MGKYQYLGDYPGITDGIGPATPGEVKDLNEDQAKIADKSTFWKKMEDKKAKGGNKK